MWGHQATHFVVLVLLLATQDDRYSNRLVASVAQTMVEDAHGMVSIAGLDAIHFLLGIRRETVHAIASSWPEQRNPYSTVGHQYFTLGTSSRNQHKPSAHFTALRTNAVHVYELSMYHRIDGGFVKRTDMLFDIATGSSSSLSGCQLDCTAKTPLSSTAMCQRRAH